MNPPLLKRRWFQNLLLVLGTAAVAYGMVYVDVLARAREAFRQGNQYLRWHNNAEEKKKHFDAQFLREREKQEKKKAKGALTAEDFDNAMETLQFDRDQTVAESSIKYAYTWFKDTYELFSPPESKYVRRARFLAPAAKQRWREELTAKGIAFEEYMLDLEVGEDPQTLMVTSTRDRAEADRCVAALKTEGIDVKLYDGPANGRLPQEGLKILVPRENFWDAHRLLDPLVAPPLPHEEPL